jgi:hypothetical protein
MTELKVLIFFFHFMYIYIDQHVLIMLLLLSFIIAIEVSDFFLDGNFLSKFNLKVCMKCKFG